MTLLKCIINDISSQKIFILQLKTGNFYFYLYPNVNTRQFQIFYYRRMSKF